MTATDDQREQLLVVLRAVDLLTPAEALALIVHISSHYSQRRVIHTVSPLVAVPVQGMAMTLIMRAAARVTGQVEPDCAAAHAVLDMFDDVLRSLGARS